MLLGAQQQQSSMGIHHDQNLKDHLVDGSETSAVKPKHINKPPQSESFLINHWCENSRYNQTHEQCRRLEDLLRGSDWHLVRDDSKNTLLA